MNQIPCMDGPYTKVLSRRLLCSWPIVSMTKFQAHRWYRLRLVEMWSCHAVAIVHRSSSNAAAMTLHDAMSICPFVCLWRWCIDGDQTVTDNTPFLGPRELKLYVRTPFNMILCFMPSSSNLVLEVNDLQPINFRVSAWSIGGVTRKRS